MNRKGWGMWILCAILAMPLVASAQQEAPFSPKFTPPGELIVTERFSTSPLVFPWTLVSSDRVARQGRLDFELIYDVDYQEMRQILQQSYNESTSVAYLQSGVVRYAEIEELLIFGLEVGERQARITLGHPDLEPVFQVEMTPQGRRTRVVVSNSTVSRQFSGFVPARIGFRPVGATPIPFRWN